MRFAKLHGLGNDFLLLDLREGGEPLPARRAVELCDRHLGVGGDGVLTLLPGRDGVRMLIQNSDGSVPEMCGNGARCAALWIATAGGARAAKARVVLETDAGPRACEVEAASAAEGLVEVDMGEAKVDPARTLSSGAARVEAWPVSMGNPHRVVFAGGGREELLHMASTLGPPLCAAENANIEFVSRTGRGRYTASVWERGAGLTQACGTGACAVAAAAIERGEAARGEDVVVELPGGPLSIRVDERNRVRMRGPAKLVFTGEL